MSPPKADVEDGTIVYSDKWHPYNNLSNNYDHSVVNHNVKEYVNGMVDTNGIEGFCNILKRGYIGIYLTMNKQHLHKYCVEFWFRYNNKEKTGVKKFENALLQTSNARITYNTLIGK